MSVVEARSLYERGSGRTGKLFGMRRLPPLDTHAHVALDIAPVELERLGAVVLIATRSLDEFQTVQSRTDRASVWGRRLSSVTRRRPAGDSMQTASRR